MRAFGNYILSGRLQAIGVISFLSLFSLLIPPLAFIASGVPIGLVALRKGGGQAIQVGMGSLILILALTYLLNIQPAVSLVIVLTIWLPVCISALALRQTESPVAMALTAAGIAVAFIIFMYVTKADVAAWWQSVWAELLDSGLLTATAEQRRLVMENAPPVMNALVASSIVTSLMITVLIARWWQAELFNPGGFSKEFHAFCLPKQLAVPTIVGVALMFLQDQTFAPILRDTLVVIVVLYLFEGIASVHRTVKSKTLSRNWLIGMYCLLAFLPMVMIIFVAWIGMTDSLLTVRPKAPDDSE